MPFQIVRNDITKMETDAIVNTTNESLKMDGWVCGDIFSAAGIEDLQNACDEIGYCQVGEAVITGGFKLPAKYIIHTVGPVWRGGNSGEEAILCECYKNSLELAKEYKCESIAFPLISSGVYGYPKDKALKTAADAIGEFLFNNDMMVYLVVYDKESLGISEKLFSSIKEYIDDKYVDEKVQPSLKDRSVKETQVTERVEYLQYIQNVAPSTILKKRRKLDEFVKHLEETFSQMLLRMIDEKGYSDVEVYKRANIDRKLFSKIRTNETYNPSKPTVIAFAIALRLNLDETRDLLKKAGYA